MPRIRTIKPEFWDSPGTAASSLRARLLFVAMWNWADDWGVGTANAAQLISFAFPNDGLTAEEFPLLAKEVADNYEVKFYKVRGRSYYAVPSWDKHQKTERKAKRAHPAPDDPDVEPYSPSDLHSGGISSAIQGDPAPLPRDDKEVQAREREQGNRGTGEVPTTSGDVVAAAIPGTEVEVAPTGPPDSADKLLAEWLRTARARPPQRVIGQVGKELRSMLNEGLDPSAIRAGFIDWQAKGQHPSTLPSFVNAAMNARPSKTNHQRATDDLFGSALERARAKEAAL